MASSHNVSCNLEFVSYEYSYNLYIYMSLKYVLVSSLIGISFSCRFETYGR